MYVSDADWADCTGGLRMVPQSNYTRIDHQIFVVYYIPIIIDHYNIYLIVKKSLLLYFMQETLYSLL